MGAWVGLREEIETGRLGKLGRDDGELALLLCTRNREEAPLFTCSREESETGWRAVFSLDSIDVQRNPRINSTIKHLLFRPRT